MTQSWQFYVISLTVFLASLVPLRIALLSRGKEGKSGIRLFSWLMVACAVYSIFYVGEFVFPSLDHKAFFLKLQYLGAVFLGPLMFGFCLGYSGRHRYLNLTFFIAVLAFPFLTLVAVFTTNWHGMFYSSFELWDNGYFLVMRTTKGWMYWAHQVYTLAFLILSYGLLIRMIRGGAITDTKQVYMVLSGLSVPFLAYVSHILRIVPLNIDPLPFAFIGMGGIVYLGLTRFHLFQVIPIVYKTLFESISDGVLVFDTLGRLVGCNPAAQLLLGRTLQLKTGHLLSEKQDLQSFIEDPQREVYEFSLTLPNSDEVWLKATKSEIKDKKSGRIGLIILFRDITKERQRQLDLERAKEEAEQASHAKSEFLANISHEIRTPLNGVIGFTELLGNTKLDKQQSRYLETVNHSANALLDLINHVLDLAKIEAGKTEMDFQEVNLYELIKSIADVVSYQSQQNDLEFLLYVSPDVPESIWADELKLKQVLINLLNNALKFTKNGEVTLEVKKVAMLDSDHVTLTFGVRDTGIGIAEEKQKMIFDAFSQEDASTTKKYGGTGLGLTISNKLLELMNSGLKLESEQGKGSYFFFEVTFLVMEDAVRPMETLEVLSPALLLVSSDKLSDILMRYLKMYAIASQRAYGIREVKEKLKVGNHKLLVVDYGTSIENAKWDPLELRDCLLLANSKSMGRLVLLPSALDDAATQKIFKIGFQGALSKPFLAIDLFKEIQQLSLPNQSGFSDETLIEQKAPSQVVKRVLLAEDNPVNRMLVKVYINNLFPHATLQEAENGKIAFDYFLKELPDLVITDLQMPEMSGYELCAAIRSHPEGKDLPVIALSAKAIKGEEERCREVGINDFITKPVRQDTFQQVIGKWL
ncbi:histidine kinase N-terminal 7TM domain-containing protein [Pleomorphovibrio marinus]|uniref:histidine kinase N-terminal 7TM domain-containing protein n=1 Tax=Pleomorphovibrio marinus TaxID=2164132 RepID=UPI000E0A897C|nr:histidine kinase N-terminal 7TM domain-containing protein [Pleomorphovibrio marinus]